VGPLSDIEFRSREPKPLAQVAIGDVIAAFCVSPDLLPELVPLPGSSTEESFGAPIDDGGAFETGSRVWLAATGQSVDESGDPSLSATGSVPGAPIAALMPEVSPTGEYLQIGESDEQYWRTYNFEVEEYHTYIADGVRVHNESILSYLPSGSVILDVDFENSSGLQEMTYRTADGAIVVATGSAFDTGADTIQIHRNIRYDQHGLQFEQDAYYDTRTGELLSAPIVSVQDSREYIGGNIGRAFGSQIGSMLGGDDAFRQIAYSTVLGTITQNFGEFLRTSIAVGRVDASVTTLGSLVDILRESTLSDFTTDFTINLTGQVTGYFSSMLMAEVSEALGLEGFSAGLFTTTGTTISQQLTANLTNVSLWENGFQYEDLMQGFNENIFASAFGSYIGGTLAREVVDIDSPVEGLFSSLGATVAQTWLSASSLGAGISSAISNGVGAVFGAFSGAVTTFMTALLIPGIGAFLGTIGGSLIFETLDRWTGGFLGGLWGQWTGDGHTNYRTDLTFDDELNRFVHTGDFEKNGNQQIREMATAMREAFSETMHAIIDDVGGDAGRTVSDPLVHFGFLHGTHDVGYNDFWTSFTSLDGSATIRLHSTDTRALVNAAIYQNLQMLSFSDGDLLEARVLEGWQASVQGLEAGSDPTSFLWLHELPEEVAPGLAEYMRRSQVADDYRRYLEDRDTIDALIANSPNSAFAAGWVATLIAALELGLDQPFNVTGTEGDNTFLGGENGDVIDGAGGNDTLRGYQGNDTLVGGAGDDLLIGDEDDDLLEGGLGDDTYVFSRGDGSDLIRDTGGNDRLILDDATGLSSLMFAREGSDLLITRTGGSDLIRIENWYLADGRIETLRIEAIEADIDLSVIAEGGNSVFPALQYIASYDDLRELLGSDAELGFAHFRDHGIAEGRAAAFDGLAYIASYGDLITGIGTNAEAGAHHFITYGHTEGRAITFNAEYYLRNYADLRDGLGADLTAATRHFIEYGFAEGRTGSGLVAGAMDDAAWASFLASFSGSSTISGTEGSDWLAGSALDDIIHGNGGSDILIGGNGRDVLVGGAGNDVLDAGAWTVDAPDVWQMLAGGSGDDTYIIGSDIGLGIIDHGGEIADGGMDTVRFEDLSISDLNIELVDHHNDNGVALRFSWTAGAGRPAGEFHIANGAEHIERFVFADGTTLSDIQFDASGGVWFVGTENDDVIIGSGGRDTIAGGSGNDVLDAGAWTVDAPDVWQMLAGGSGDDTYIVGSDIGLGIIDHGGEIADGGVDTVRFEDLSISDLNVELVDHQNAIGVALRFWWTAGAGRPAGEFHIANGAEHIERFVFADETSLSDIQIDASGNLTLIGTDGHDTIVGGDGRDVLFGGGGNDVLDAGAWAIDAPNVWQMLAGGAGDDTYIVGSDIGLGIIDHGGEIADGGVDTVRFEDLSISDLNIELVDHQNANGVALRFWWAAGAGRPAGEFHIANGAEHIERFVFADETTLSDIQIDASGNLTLIGTDGHDTIVGGDGRDVLAGGSGNDVLDAGAWTVDAPDVWQMLAGGSGDDTYIIGSDIGLGIIDHGGEIADGGMDTVRFEDLSISDLNIELVDHQNANGEALRFWWAAGADRPAGEFHIANGAQHIERFVFADETTLSDIQIDASGNLTLIGTDGHDTIVGGDGRDILAGGSGNDVLDAGAWTVDAPDVWQMLAGGSGDDTYIIGSDIGLGIIDHGGEIADGGVDTVRFEDLSISDLNIELVDHQNANGVALRFWWTAGAGRPAGEFHIANGAEHIERFVFADETTLSDIQIDASGNLTLIGTDGHDTIVGGDGRDVLFGGGGNDVLDAGAWTIDAPNVWQMLAGGAGDDTYIVGSDIGLGIIDHGGEIADGGVDTVRFEDLSISDLNIELVDHQNANGVALRFWWAAGAGRPAGEFHIANGAEHIERFVFADETTLSDIQIDASGNLTLIGTDGHDTIVGGDGRDVLAGGSGNDVLDAGAWTVDAPDVWQMLAGGSGDDTYIIGSDIGLGIIDHGGEIADGGMDTVRFEDLSISDLNIELVDHQNANGEALRFWWAAGADRPAGEFHIANGAQHIERFEFADGTTLSDIQIDASGNLTLIGTDGHDTIVGGAGADAMIGGLGDDTFAGGTGADTFVFNSAGEADRILDFEVGVDRIEIALGVTSFSQITVTDDDLDTVLAFGSNTVRLVNFDHNALQESDFAFL
jgi:Ca2+-binding RTX toxin-like protein